MALSQSLRSSLADTLLFAVAESLAEDRRDIAETLLRMLDTLDHSCRDAGAMLYLRHEVARMRSRPAGDCR